MMIATVMQLREAPHRVVQVRPRNVELRAR